MTSDQEKCGLTSLLPVSCRGRAEAFARRLHTRLSSLGNNHHSNDDLGADETSWLANHENPIALSQPQRHTSDSSGDIYYDYADIESPSSPEEELNHSEFERLLNHDSLKLSNHHYKHQNDHDDSCHSSTKDNNKLKNISLTNGHTQSNDNSDSSEAGVVFHDSRDDLDDSKTSSNGIDTCDNDEQDELYATSSSTTDNTIPPESSSLSEDLSSLTLSDNPSTECSEPKINGSIPIIINDDENKIDNDNVNTSTGLNDSSCSGRLPNTEDCNNETHTSSLNNTNELPIECPKNLIKTDLLQIRRDDLDNNHQGKEGDDNEEEEEGEEEEERIPRIRRCSSLKTGKTPPGTPGRKKIVRFADVLGLDLADVRTFLDDIPKIPISAYNDLKDADINDDNDNAQATITTNTATTLDPHLKFHGIKIDKLLVPLFQQPGGLSDFLDKVRDKCVCLENAIVDDPIAFCVKGTVRVRNLDFHKSVHIRYSLDQWKTYADVQAIYVLNSCDGFSDTFSFTIYAHTLGIGQRLEFAVRFQCKGCQYWDNNNGINYVFQCLPSSNNHNTSSSTSSSSSSSSAPAAASSYTPMGGVDDSWGASFY